ncbi:hypothetical protein B7759_01400 [Burkholderia glumae]|uniref:hypothetical protein n=1 Tax=Burkholderia glumae TaxID=337 RepID=UPI001AEB3047|nr:hypothetical protein [Burkholderia glumae]QTP32822.1 hypothetical protein B7759_01400 [Burkholderia glumae]
MSESTVTISTPIANRKELAEAFGQNQSAVRRIEAMTKDITVNIPDYINQTNDLAAALAKIAFVVRSLDVNAPNAVALSQGTGLNITFGQGSVTISLSVPVNVANGGTGVTNIPPHGVVIGTGASPVQAVLPGNAGWVLMSNGGSSDPSYQAVVNSVSPGLGLSVSSPTGAVSVSLQVPVTVANGGTGTTSASGATLDNITGFSGIGILRRTGAGAYTFDSISAYLQAGNNLSDLASIPTARTNLGLGSIATQNSSSVAITGGTIDGTAIGSTTTATGKFSTLTNGDTVLMRTSASLSNGAASQTATLTNGPIAGNPTKWIPINDNGATRYIPAW